ncbi:hypothetical protein COLO4_22755 [Corchorus olitorius]|uniref:Uncharacterized protein n=1 Tax=Corchorus olitorius TaxID=93759 RepID=A0A1R3IK42_9ROSI|nr:hypothetical protein COLO4_22755 [Corchorus olitorius]
MENGGAFRGSCEREIIRDQGVVEDRDWLRLNPLFVDWFFMHEPAEFACPLKCL